MRGAARSASTCSSNLRDNSSAALYTGVSFWLYTYALRNTMRTCTMKSCRQPPRPQQLPVSGRRPSERRVQLLGTPARAPPGLRWCPCAVATGWCPGPWVRAAVVGGVHRAREDRVAAVNDNKRAATVSAARRRCAGGIVWHECTQSERGSAWLLQHGHAGAVPTEVHWGLVCEPVAHQRVVALERRQLFIGERHVGATFRLLHQPGRDPARQLSRHVAAPQLALEFGRGAHRYLRKHGSICAAKEASSTPTRR
eukprot:scaffold241_cov229-Prasinococcus_capsulatus_cf.AAC.4